MTTKPQTSSLAYDAALADVLDLHRSGVGPSAFYKGFLEIVGERFHVAIALIEVDLVGQLVSHDWRDEEQSPDAWQPAVETFLTESRAATEPRCCAIGSGGLDLDAVLVAVPILDPDGNPVGTLALAAPGGGNGKELVHQLQSLSLLASLAPSAAPASAARPKRSGPSGKSLSKLAGFDGPTELAFAITNNLRNKAGCDLCALGLVRGQRVKVEALSGQEEVKHNSPALVAIQGAMEECLDLGEDILVQREEGGADDPPMLHRQCSESAGDLPIASLLFEVDERPTAVVTLRRPKGEPFDREELDDLRKLVQPYVEGFGLVEAASRSLRAHVAQRIGDFSRSLVTRGSWGRKALVASLVLAVGWFLFGRTMFHVEAPCVVAATEVQHVTAPFEGQIRSAPLVAGDPFREGDILCTLDATAQELEASRLASELEIAAIEESQALAQRDPLTAELARRRSRNLQAQLDLVQHRIERAVVRAPFDGFVLSGDLRARIGDAATPGEPLFQLARADSLKLELRVAEADVRFLQTGLGGEFACVARPEDERPLEVARVFPSVGASADGVLVEARTLDAAPWLRPGMEGVARVEINRRPVWWVNLRGAMDFLHLRFWL